MQLRDSEFVNAYKAFMAYETMNDRVFPEGERVGIIHCGAPAGGMNSATRVAVRYALGKGLNPVGINNGFVGLAGGDVSDLSWESVSGWMSAGGSYLGTNRDLPSKDIGMCAYQMQKHNIKALLVIGGFEAYSSLLTLVNNRKLYPAFCIPMILIPATISNNVPGTEYSLGSDTALNIISESCDRLKQSASSSRKRLFVVEVQGGQCGYLATLGGLASGAITSYIPEEGINLRRIQRDVEHLKERYKSDKVVNEGRVVIRNDGVSNTYTTDMLSKLLEEEGRGLFGVKSTVLGHIQQGGTPSPFGMLYASI
jgi:6-phosphofructokinase 1